MTRRAIRAEVEAQAGKRWADFILKEGEFAGARNSYPPKPRPELTEFTQPAARPLAQRHLEATGETVLETATRYRAQGMRISTAALHIGFAHGAAMRDYMRRQGLTCPWPSRRETAP